MLRKAASRLLEKSREFKSLAWGLRSDGAPEIWPRRRLMLGLGVGLATAVVSGFAQETPSAGSSAGVERPSSDEYERLHDLGAYSSAGHQKGIVIFSGGTGFNAASRVLQEEQAKQYEYEAFQSRLRVTQGPISPAASAATAATTKSTSAAVAVAPHASSASGGSPPPSAHPTVARVSYILPVSDDGGSTAEIVRVLGEWSRDLAVHGGC